MKKLTLALTLITLAGCAQLKEWSQDADAPAGATARSEASPYPKPYPNDHFLVP
jgi:hypothetical protein